MKGGRNNYTAQSQRNSSIRNFCVIGKGGQGWGSSGDYREGHQVTLATTVDRHLKQEKIVRKKVPEAKDWGKILFVGKRKKETWQTGGSRKEKRRDGVYAGTGLSEAWRLPGNRRERLHQGTRGMLGQGARKSWELQAGGKDFLKQDFESRTATSNQTTQNSKEKKKKSPHTPPQKTTPPTTQQKKKKSGGGGGESAELKDQSLVAKISRGRTWSSLSVTGNPLGLGKRDQESGQRCWGKDHGWQTSDPPSAPARCAEQRKKVERHIRRTEGVNRSVITATPEPQRDIRNECHRLLG